MDDQQRQFQLLLTAIVKLTMAVKLMVISLTPNPNQFGCRFLLWGLGTGPENASSSAASGSQLFVCYVSNHVR
jgi:hypothetical protein